ncbi:porin [Haloferula sp. A504]|uniref:porin n=1 Tax=Haloferula sp. A504 TaxID=3373601 RepID=UPI0031C873B5|nr:OprO/OprP family phosphate-selective porin [Verrucomicrobiaceae bacterium E54]
MKQLTHALRIALPVVMIGTAHAETAQSESSILESINQGDWCEWLSNKPGTLYKNPENPFIQEFGVFGRLQWQAAYIWGDDVNGYEFGDDYTEFRRARLGASLKFLQYFQLKANVNVVSDQRPSGGSLGWGYEDFDEALLIFNAKKAFGIDGLDSLDIAYGRFKFVLGSEARESSKKLLTVERSSIANKVFNSYRVTGLGLEATRGPWEMVARIYSTDASVTGGNVEMLGGWNDGLAFYLGLGYSPTDEWSFYWDFIYNDADVTSGEDSLFAYNWATVFTAAYSQGRWGVNTDYYLGDNGDLRNGQGNRNRQGNFWGAVIMPYYWVVEDKVQFVVRYQYQGSSERQGIRTYSRYFRRNHGPTVNVAGGRGDTHQTLYAGVNWLLCGHNLKVQAGLEYDWLNAPQVGTTGEADALTAWFAFRSYF